MNYFNKNKNKYIGIVSFGAAVPRYRITTEEISKAWEKISDEGKALGIKEKTVPSSDQDTITLAVDATNTALHRFNKENTKIGAIYTGSESHPYAVKSSSAVVGEAIGISNNYTAADLEFACKAGTAAMQIVSSEVLSGMIEYGLAIGADTAQSRPGDALEYSAGAAGAAFIIGSKKDEIIAKLIATTSITSDTPDFWRREHMLYPSHGGRFTGEPAYFKHVKSAIIAILKLTSYKFDDFKHVVLHMPNGRFPKAIAQCFGIKDEQMETGFVVPYLGNSYSASSLIGFINVLENSKPGDKILLCSYGSGSGSDAFIFEVTENILKYNLSNPLKNQIKNKKYITYTQYRRFTNKNQI